jgi:gas vesicle protein
MGQDSDTQRLTHDIEDTRADLSRNVDELTDRVSPSRVVERRVERTRSGLTRFKESIMGSASDAKQSVMGSASSAKESVAGSASGTGGSMSDTASSTVDTAKQKAQGNPLAAGLLAFGAGWLVSSLLPASEKEARAAQTLEDAAKEHGQPLKEQATQVGREVGETMKERASEAAEEVKSTAQDSTERVKGEGQSSAENVRSEAPGT